MLKILALCLCCSVRAQDAQQGSPGIPGIVAPGVKPGFPTQAPRQPGNVNSLKRTPEQLALEAQYTARRRELFNSPAFRSLSRREQRAALRALHEEYRAKGRLDLP